MKKCAAHAVRETSSGIKKTHKPSFSIILMAKSTAAQAGMLFENGMGNGSINGQYEESDYVFHKT
jgi:hypothetical protein